MKQKHNRFLILILWFIFTYPVVYQAIHIVLHHHVKHTESPGLVAESNVTDSDECFVCDYEFFISDLPKTFQPDIAIFSNEVELSTNLQSDISTFELPIPLNRGPPEIY